MKIHKNICKLSVLLLRRSSTEVLCLRLSLLFPRLLPACCRGKKDCQDVFFVLHDTPSVWPWLQMRPFGLSLMLRASTCQSARGWTVFFYIYIYILTFLCLLCKDVYLLSVLFFRLQPLSPECSPLLISAAASAPHSASHFLYSLWGFVLLHIFLVLISQIHSCLWSSKCSVDWNLHHIIKVLQNHLHSSPNFKVPQEAGRKNMKSDSLNMRKTHHYEPLFVRM